jgi:hypothetical protein
MLNHRDLETWLAKKLKYEKNDRRRHIHFLPRIHGRQVPLPTIVALTRGSGDVGDNVVRGIAEALGVRVLDVRRSTKCTVGAACMYVCQAVYCILFCKNCLVLDPTIHQENVAAMGVSVSRLVSAAECIMREGPRRWCPDEQSAIAHCLARLSCCEERRELCGMVALVRGLVERYA